MESTETMSHIPASSLAIRLKWDLFLSFRGVDTRDGFTTSLFNSLRDQNVRSFMDSEGMQAGDEISPTIIEAIEDSAAAIAVISPRYAESHRCLEELSRIFQNKRLVLPVFYEVEPRDVRKLGGPFEEVFRSHEERYEESAVLRWRQALKKAGSLSGYVLNRRLVALIYMLLRFIELRPSYLVVDLKTHGPRELLCDVMSQFRGPLS